MSQLESFRQEVKDWLEENCPPSMKTPMPEDEVVWGGRNAVYKNPESKLWFCLLYTSPSPRDLSTSRMPSSA